MVQGIVKKIVRVPFDKLNLVHTINESDMDIDDKNKISSWTR